MKNVCLVICLVLVSAVAAIAGSNPIDIGKGIVNLNAILGVFGVSFLGLLGYVAKLKIGASKVRAAVKEWGDAISEVKKNVTDPTLRKELDEAFEATADLCEGVGLKDLSKKLRTAL